MRKLLCIALIACLFNLTSCGYFLYPERVGQTDGKLDSTVVILDALGLFVGVIPGIVAFAVDISTGTIYLPPGESSAIEKHRDRTTMLEGLDLEEDDLEAVKPVDASIDRDQLALKLSARLGIDVNGNEIQLYQIKNASTQLALSAVK